MISHGVSTGALFLLLGMLYERRHTRLIADFGGLGRSAPWFATAFVITALASIGLPGTSGFVGEFLALLGTFESHPGFAVLAGTGVIFAAYYMLPMTQRIWFNKLDKEENRIADLSKREMVILGPMLALMIVIGVFPTPILERMEPSVRAVLERVDAGRSVAVEPDGATIEMSSVDESQAIPGDGGLEPPRTARSNVLAAHEDASDDGGLSSEADAPGNAEVED
jgi:NADH-quinone oxidoreductase subunit M